MEGSIGAQDSVLHTCHSTLDSDFAATAPPTVIWTMSATLQNDRSIDEYQLPIHHNCRPAGSTVWSEGRQLESEV